MTTEVPMRASRTGVLVPVTKGVTMRVRLRGHVRMSNGKSHGIYVVQELELDH